jgi:DeoR/GlpR family transcriptional regulator of sugar metabolism
MRLTGEGAMNMLYINSRRNQIVEILQKNRSVTVNKLIDDLNVSPATVRKDLVHLEKSGVISRTRGEAHLVGSENRALIEVRQRICVAEKQMIARRALEFIQNGDTIILDSGTTLLELAKLFGNFEKLTVITYSLEIGYYLSRYPKINLIMPGGMLNRSTLSLLGSATENFFEQIEAAKCFMSASSVRKLNGLTLEMPYECTVKRAAIKASGQVIALLDHTKFHTASIEPAIKFNEIDILITDSEIGDPEMLAILNENGVRLVIA